MLTNRNTGAKQITISINCESQKNCDEFHEQIAIFCKNKPWLSENVTYFTTILVVFALIMQLMMKMTMRAMGTMMKCSH